MLLGRCRVEKVAASDIIPHEESICAGIIATDDAVTLLASKADEGFQTGAEIIGTVPRPRRIIGDDERHRRTQRRIIFDDDDAWFDRREGLPDPVVIVVNIDTEQIDVSRHAGLFKHRVDILRGDQVLAEPKLALCEKRTEMVLDFDDILRAPLRSRARSIPPPAT